MISRELEAEILRLYHTEKWPVGTLARQLKVHRDTVRRVLAQAGISVAHHYTRPSMVEPFIPFIQDMLARYPTLRASRLYRMVRERGYPGAPDHFRSIVARLRPRPPAEAYLRLRTLAAEQGQVDWAHFGKLTVGRAQRDLFAFVMVMAYSRLRFITFSMSAEMPSFLRGHVAAFRFFSAVPRVILYDNLKSAVLERAGDAVRFHPTLLALAGHYRFEPRACAPYRPNEKGRVERAIRDVREGFFAARDFTSLDDLNAQALTYCKEIAKERRVPDAKEKTIADAYVEELPRLIVLPDDHFPVEERVTVRVGKTPYVRFDLNDYSVPHTHAERSLTVLATEDRVRIVDPDVPLDKPLADHRRSYDRDQRIEQPEHLRALVEDKRRAHQSRGFDRLFSATPSARLMMERLADRGANLGATTSGLLQLLDRVGADLLERALAEVVAKDQLTLRALHHEVDRLRYEAGLDPALTVPVTADLRARTQVRPHALSAYDRLHVDHGGTDDDR